MIHNWLERNSILLLIGILVVVAIIDWISARLRFAIIGSRPIS